MTELTLKDKREIMRRCLEEARKEGGDPNKKLAKIAETWIRVMGLNSWLEVKPQIEKALSNYRSQSNG